MNRRAALPLVLLAACGGGAPVPGPDLALALASSATTVEFGAAFPLTVTRTYRAHLRPEPWRDDAFPPVQLHVLTQERTQRGDLITETWTCRAHAFAVGDLQIGGAMRASSSTGDLSARCEPLLLTVRSSLPATAATAIELPTELLRPATPARWPWLLAAAVALLGGGIAWSRRPRPLPAPPPPPPAPDPKKAAHDRLLALAAVAVDGDAATVRCHDDLAQILRDYVGATTTVPAQVRTTEELASVVAEPLRQLLQRCDLVKFARLRPTAAACATTVADAVRHFAADEARP